VLEGHVAELADEGVLPAIAHHGRQVRPERVMHRPLLEKRDAPERLGVVAPQQRTGRGQREDAPRLLTEQLERPQRAHQPIGQRGIETEPIRNVLRHLGCRPDDVEDAKRDASIEDLAPPAAKDQVENPPVRIHPGPPVFGPRWHLKWAWAAGPSYSMKVGHLPRDFLRNRPVGAGAPSVRLGA